MRACSISVDGPFKILFELFKNYFMGTKALLQKCLARALEGWFSGSWWPGAEFCWDLCWLSDFILWCTGYNQHCSITVLEQIFFNLFFSAGWTNRVPTLEPSSSQSRLLSIADTRNKCVLMCLVRGTHASSKMLNLPPSRTQNSTERKPGLRWTVLHTKVRRWPNSSCRSCAPLRIHYLLIMLHMFDETCMNFVTQAGPPPCPNLISFG